MHSIDRKPIGEQQQQPLSSQQALPLPQQPNEQYQGSDMANPDTTSIKSKESVDTAADVEQHCLLFPTYATRHSRSGMLFVCRCGEICPHGLFFCAFFFWVSMWHSVLTKFFPLHLFMDIMRRQ